MKPAHYELVLYVINRINTLSSLLRLFDLLHDHYSNETIPEHFRSQEEVLESQTTLNIVIVSYTCSLFDKRGIDIRNLNRHCLSDQSAVMLDEILALWDTLEVPISKIRNNAGFHGGLSRQTTHLFKTVKHINEQRVTPSLVLLEQKLERFAESLEHENLSKKA